MNTRKRLEKIEKKLNNTGSMTPRLLELTLMEIYRASEGTPEEIQECKGLALALEMKALLLTIGSSAVNCAHNLVLSTYCKPLEETDD